MRCSHRFAEAGAAVDPPHAPPSRMRPGLARGFLFKLDRSREARQGAGARHRQTEAPSLPVRKSKLVVRPPSAITSAPFKAAEASDSRNSAAFATSPGSVILPAGWRAARVAWNFSGSRADLVCRLLLEKKKEPGLRTL